MLQSLLALPAPSERLTLPRKAVPMRHPYADFISKVEKPARYMGGEYRSIVKDHATVDVTMALAFPDLYDIGMSHLGTKILYSVLNRNPRIAAERCFAPWPDLERELGLA